MDEKTSVWQLHEAKARFSELFRSARSEGPQKVVKQGGGAVIVAPAELFDRGRDRSGRSQSISDFFGSAPRAGRSLKVDRKRDITRTIKW